MSAVAAAAASRPAPVISGRDIEVGATIGISPYPEDGGDAGSLLRAADWALYRGKDEGRNRLRRFQQDKSD